MRSASFFEETYFPVSSNNPARICRPILDYHGWPMLSRSFAKHAAAAHTAASSFRQGAQKP
jgi:hypothetical protein